MLSNNIKGVIYFGMWYLLVAAFYFLDNFKGLVGNIIPKSLGPTIFISILTIIYTVFFTMLFLKKQYSLAANISSCATIIILDILVVTGAGIAYIFGQINSVEILFVLFAIILKQVVTQFILSAKKE